MPVQPYRQLGDPAVDRPPAGQDRPAADSPCSGSAVIVSSCCSVSTVKSGRGRTATTGCRSPEPVSAASWADVFTTRSRPTLPVKSAAARPGSQREGGRGERRGKGRGREREGEGGREQTAGETQHISLACNWRGWLPLANTGRHAVLGPRVVLTVGTMKQ